MSGDVCAFDNCQLPGICDGRHCEAAGGAIRLSPKEHEAARRRRALKEAVAVLTPPPDAQTHTVSAHAARAALDVILDRLREADPTTLADLGVSLTTAQEIGS
jgi:hypothetical protein